MRTFVSKCKIHTSSHRKMSKNNQSLKNLKKYIYAIISMALVLFIIGFYGVLLLFGQQTINSIKENLEIIVELTPNTSKTDREILQVYLENQMYAKSKTVKFVSKEDGLKRLEKDFGDDVIEFDFDNPLFDIFTFNVNTAYAQSDSLKHIKLDLIENKVIQDVHYQDVIVTNLEYNSKRVRWLILVVGGLMLSIAIALINNTVRLALNDNRFIIKNMQFVGATEGFIIKPYLQKAIIHGLISSVLAIAAIFGVLNFLNNEVPNLLTNLWSIETILLFGILFLLGIIISSLSTLLAVRRFLRKRTEQLY